MKLWNFHHDSLPYLDYLSIRFENLDFRAIQMISEIAFKFMIL
jgi:hypothetical protein